VIGLGSLGRELDLFTDGNWGGESKGPGRNIPERAARAPVLLFTGDLGYFGEDPVRPLNHRGGELHTVDAVSVKFRARNKPITYG